MPIFEDISCNISNIFRGHFETCLSFPLESRLTLYHGWFYNLNVAEAPEVEKIDEWW